MEKNWGLMAMTCVVGFIAFYLHYAFSVQFSHSVMTFMFENFEHLAWFESSYLSLTSLMGIDNFQLLFYFVMSLATATILGFSLGMLIKSDGYFIVYVVAILAALLICYNVYVPDVMTASGYNQGRYLTFSMTDTQLLLQMLVHLPLLLLFSFWGSHLRQAVVQHPLICRLKRFNPDIVFKA
ncbi:hypothetical protein HR060_01495 [Catenovulum sp. SM1970]|nr:hypothetical protein [Marinifaba aquimaris]